jgi:hypothetical protein
MRVIGSESTLCPFKTHEAITAHCHVVRPATEARQDSSADWPAALMVAPWMAVTVLPDMVALILHTAPGEPWKMVLTRLSLCCRSELEADKLKADLLSELTGLEGAGPAGADVGAGEVGVGVADDEPLPDRLPEPEPSLELGEELFLVVGSTGLL